MFWAASTITTGLPTRDVVTSDFNGDGHLDLATAGRVGGAVKVLFGDGDGGFGAPVVYTGADDRVGLSMADVDGDGRPDLLFSAGSNGISALFGQADGTFVDAGVVVPYATTAWLATDFDLNGTIDAAVFNITARIWLNDGTATFSQDSTTLNPSFGNTSMAAGDVDADGFADVYFTSGSTVEGFAGHPGPSFTFGGSVATGAGATALNIVQLDGANSLDLVLLATDDDQLVVHLHNGGGFTGPVAYDVGDAPSDLLLADLNGDGHLDAAVLNGGDNSVSLLYGDGTGAFGAATTFAVPGTVLSGLAAGDFDGDGAIDLAVGSDGELLILVDAELDLAATTATQTEGGAFTFTVTRSGSTLGALSVDWAVTGAGGAPASADDFQGGVLPSGTVNFASGQASATITLTAASSGAVEATEGFDVTLTNPTGAGLGTASAGATIQDSSPPEPPRPTPTMGGDRADVAFLDNDPNTYSGLGGSDYIRGEAGADTLQGNTGADEIYGGAGSDLLYGGKDADLVDGGAGDDSIYGDLGDDRLRGGEGNDRVQGGAGNDRADGDDGADTVRGGQGEDALQGGAGNDWLSGDQGADTLAGGSGADTFHIFAGAGTDLVTDFNAAEGDRIQLLPGSIYTVGQVGADTVVEFSDAKLLIQNVQLSSLPDGWIFGA